MKLLYIITMILGGNFWTIAAESGYSDHRNQKVDSLEQLLATHPPTDPNTLSKIYGSLSWGYLQTDRAKSEYYCRQRIEIGKKHNGWSALSNAYRVLGIHQYGAAQYDSAMFYYEKSLYATEQMRNYPSKYKLSVIEDNLSTLYGSIANLYNIQGLNLQAIEWYGKALKLFEKYDWKESMCIAYHNIGELYLCMNNYPQAEKNYLLANHYAHLTNDSLMGATSMKGLCQIEYLHYKNYEKALLYADSALAYYSVHPEEASDMSIVLMYKGDIYLEGYDDDKNAEQYARQAMSILESPREQAQARLLLAAVYLKRKQWREAEQTALEALSIDASEPNNTMNLYKTLNQAYTHLGDATQAEQYFNRFDSLKSSYANSLFQSTLTEMEVKYETEKKETRITTLEKLARRRLYLEIAGSIVLILTGISFLFAWLWSRQRRRKIELQLQQLEQEKLLVATQAALDGEVQERSRLARDLHDGLGGFLAAAKFNVSDLQQDAKKRAAIERINNAIQLIDDSMREMRRIAHHLMPETLQIFGLKRALEDFCKNISTATFSWYGDETRFDRQLEILCYRIMHELVSNAMKHAKATQILVEIVRYSDHIAMTVQDNGCGFDVENVQAGMGLQNIRNRIAAHSGILLVDSQAGQGTEISVELKIENHE